MVLIPTSRREELERLFGVSRPVALVTGSGANRVGKVIARALGEAGYTLVLHANHSLDAAEQTRRQWEAEGIPTSCVQGAIDDEATLDGWMQTILSRHQQLHVVVNSAAVWDPTPLEQLDAAAMEKQWRVNLLGPTLLARRAGLVMAGQTHGGAIVNIGDTAVHHPYADFAAYLLSKAAIPMLTQLMAVELGQRNPRIRVACIHPGPVLLDASLPPAKREKIIEQALLKREGSPWDVARAALHLIESPFVTGACLNVDGGRGAYAPGNADTLAHPTYEPHSPTKKPS
jgi:pteridine reductase